MKAKFLRLRRRLAQLPIIGRILRIIVAFYRLPEIRIQAFEFSKRKSELESSSMSERMPSLIDLSRINREIHEVRAFASSLPASLRSQERSIRETREKLAVLENVFHLHSDRIEFVRYELLAEQKFGSDPLRIPPLDKIDILELKSKFLESYGSLKLNLGAGHKPVEGHINADMRNLPGIDLVCSVNNLPFADGELDEIFSSHVLEHFPREALRRDLIPHLYKKLRPGGVLRTIAPNVPAMIKSYGDGEIDYDWLSKVLYGGQEYDGDFHYSGLSPKTLGSILEEAGFKEIQTVDESRMNSGCLEFELVATK